MAEPKFKPGDRFRAITNDEDGSPYDLRFHNEYGTVIRRAGDGLYYLKFDRIDPPSGGMVLPGDPEAYWSGLDSGIVHAFEDSDLEPYRMEFELACAIGKLYKETV